MKKFVFVLTLGVLLSMGTAYAQETTGAIIGVVTSQDGATMPGVTVQIVDEATGFERVTVTNAAGEYKFVALKPARYNLNATLDGFQTYQRAIEVGLGRTVKNDFVMTLGAVTDVIEVTGEAPLVDVTSTTTGLTVNTDDLNANVPVGREVTQIALMAPATVNSDASFNSDSSYTPGQDVASIGGASPGENVYAVNGLNVTNFRNFVGSTFVPFEFLEEAQIKTGGYEAEFSRATGGVINMVTKSGTNSFHGGASIYWEPEDLQEQSPDAFNRDNQEEYSKSLEAQLSIGGPIIKDHLFFFVFGRYIDSEYSQQLGSSDTGDTGRMTVTKNSAPYYGGKVDWNITNNHRLEATYLDDSTDLDNDRYVYNAIDRTVGDYLGTGVNSRGGVNYIFKYTGIFTDNFLASGQYGVNEFDRQDGSNADECPHALDQRVSSTPIGCWVNWQIALGGDTRTAYRIDADWYLGNHSIRGGYDNEDLESTENAIYSGNAQITYDLNAQYDEIPVGADVVSIRTRNTGGTFESTNTGIYLQDSWAITSGLTLNFGVRWEQFESFNSAGEAFIKIDDQYAPRIGVIWDPSGTGRNKLYASFGQYHIPIATNTNIRLAGVEYDSTSYYEVINQLPDGTPFNPDGTPTGLGQLLEVTDVSSGEIPDVTTIVASTFDPMSQIEYIIGFEQMVGADWSFGIRGVHRNFVEVIEDFTIDEGLANKYGLDESFFNYVLGNPGSSYEGFYDLDGDGTPEPISFTAEELGYPEAQRDYWAIELTANRRFANNWMFQGSYTWSQSYGNYEGYLKSDLGQDDAGLTQDFDFAGLMDNAYGFLPNDRRHNLKVYGTYSFDFGLQLGAFVYYRTGRPIISLAKHPTDPFATLYGVGSFFEQTAPGAENAIPAPRGNQGTTDDVYGLDALIKYDFRLGGMDLFARLDIFNLFDNSANLQVREFSGTSSFNVDEGFLQTTVYQAPRTVRFGVGLSF